MKRQEQHRGFTLVEMLVVIAILAILVALVVGIGGYVYEEGKRKETAANLTFLVNAVQAYYEDFRFYPGYPAPEPNPDREIELVDCSNTTDPAYVFVQQFLTARGVKQKLLDLPRKAWEGQAGNRIRDAWGNAIRYERSGGLGGRPVFISAGSDGNFTTTGDNVRSDKQ